MAGKVLMQGRNTVTQEIVTWPADSADWAGAESPVPVADIVLYTRSRESVATSVTVPIACTLLDPTAAEAMVGVPVLITGRTTRPASSVAVGFAGFSGSATITGLDWRIVATPTLSGSRAVTATATDATNGTTGIASTTFAVAVAAVYPSSATPLAWFDGVQGPAFSDSAGTVAAPVGGLVRRVNELSPLTHNWQTPAATLARRAAVGLRLEPTLTPDYPLVSVSSATSINLDNSTLIVSWIQREGDGTLGYAGAPAWGGFANGAYANFSGTYGFAGFATTTGARHTLSIVWTSTAIKAVLMTNGVITGSTTITMSVPSGSPNSAEFILGQFQSSLYITLVQWVAINSAVSDSKATELRGYADSIPAGPAFPLSSTLFIVDGDSIAQGAPGPTPYEKHRWITLRGIRGTYDAEMLCVAVGGSGVNGHPSVAAPFVNSARQRHITLFAAGTNDISTGYSGAATAADYLTTCDTYRAMGTKVVACTLVDRRGLLTVSQPAMDAGRATFNSTIRAASTRYDALADIALVSGLGANGDADNLTLFTSDKVHPTAAGHALYAPPITAAVLSLL